ncbi:epimerase family protein Mb2239 [Acidimicrobiaceae bacterium]|nr:epimerase family protein Mb2239 [Acidimicrobiaceae bacterium]
MKIIVTGASGLIGKPLVKNLRKHGHEVVQLVRRTAQANESQWNPATGQINASVIDGADAVIHLSGAGIGDRRWTAKYKQELLESRTKTTALLASTIANSAKKPSVFLSGSAIGIYGPRGDEELTEQSSSGSSFLADICKQWEAAAKPAVDAGVRTVYLRTGIVLTPLGGALKKQLPLFKLGLGGKFGDGRAWQSWISLDDELAAIEYLLTANISGAANLTAPNPVTNAEFTNSMARTLKRLAILPIPKFGPKLLLGGELADALLFTGQRVMPIELQKSGFTFQHQTIDIALRALLNK